MMISKLTKPLASWLIENYFSALRVVVVPPFTTLAQHCSSIGSTFCVSSSSLYTVDLVIFARFQFSRISRGSQIREFKNLVKIINIIALRKAYKNSRILNFGKSPKIRSSRKFKHAKITRSTVYKRAVPTHHVYHDCVNDKRDTPRIVPLNPLTVKLFNGNFYTFVVSR